MGLILITPPPTLRQLVRKDLVLPRQETMSGVAQQARHILNGQIRGGLEEAMTRGEGLGFRV